MPADRLPQVGEVWDMTPTAEMRRQRLTRAVRIVQGARPDVRNDRVTVEPAEGTGRTSNILLADFLRRFTPREEGP